MLVVQLPSAQIFEPTWWSMSGSLSPSLSTLLHRPIGYRDPHLFHLPLRGRAEFLFRDTGVGSRDALPPPSAWQMCSACQDSPRDEVKWEDGFFVPSSSVKQCQSRQLEFINEAGKTAVSVLCLQGKHSG